MSTTRPRSLKYALFTFTYIESRVPHKPCSEVRRLLRYASTELPGTKQSFTTTSGLGKQAHNRLINGPNTLLTNEVLIEWIPAYTQDFEAALTAEKKASAAF